RLRQGPRRHVAPRPHRRRRPHCPLRPWPHHLAPARRMAPRTGVNDPVRSCLRPTLPGGLTSPDKGHAAPPVPHPPHPDPQPGTGQATGHVSGSKATATGNANITPPRRPPENDHLNSGGGSRLSSCCVSLLV